MIRFFPESTTFNMTSICPVVTCIQKGKTKRFFLSKYKSKIFPERALPSLGHIIWYTSNSTGFCFWPSNIRGGFQRALVSISPERGGDPIFFLSSSFRGVFKGSDKSLLKKLSWSDRLKKQFCEGWANISN